MPVNNPLRLPRIKGQLALLILFPSGTELLSSEFKVIGLLCSEGLFEFLLGEGLLATAGRRRDFLEFPREQRPEPKGPQVQPTVAKLSKGKEKVILQVVLWAVGEDEELGDRLAPFALALERVLQQGGCSVRAINSVSTMLTEQPIRDGFPKNAQMAATTRMKPHIVHVKTTVRCKCMNPFVR